MHYYSNELYHHGILGMKWGIRRYQNEDGTLTDVGKKRYAKDFEKATKLNKRSVNMHREKSDLENQKKVAEVNRDKMSQRISYSEGINFLTNHYQNKRDQYAQDAEDLSREIMTMDPKIYKIDRKLRKRMSKMVERYGATRVSEAVASSHMQYAKEYLDEILA